MGTHALSRGGRLKVEAKIVNADGWPGDMAIAVVAEGYANQKQATENQED
jgi:hypothetical protein